MCIFGGSLCGRLFFFCSSCLDGLKNLIFTAVRFRANRANYSKVVQIFPLGDHTMEGIGTWYIVC